MVAERVLEEYVYIDIRALITEISTLLQMNVR